MDEIRLKYVRLYVFWTCFVRFGCVSDVFWTFSDLRIGVSREKNDAEADFQVRWALAPPKPSKNCKKLTFRSENFAITNFVFSKNQTLVSV